MRSGENASEKSIPAVRPDAFSRIGRTTSSVVPGYVVDSSETSVPWRSSVPAVSAAARTAVRSGPSACDSGVGTQITITSGWAPPAPPEVARNPRLTISATWSSLRSSTCDRPAFSEPVISARVS